MSTVLPKMNSVVFDTVDSILPSSLTCFVMKKFGVEITMLEPFYFGTLGPPHFFFLENSI